MTAASATMPQHQQRTNDISSEHGSVVAKTKVAAGAAVTAASATMPQHQQRTNNASSKHGYTAGWLNKCAFMAHDPASD